jgi:hypothetical protein
MLIDRAELDRVIAAAQAELERAKAAAWAELDRDRAVGWAGYWRAQETRAQEASQNLGDRLTRTGDAIVA